MKVLWVMFAPLGNAAKLIEGKSTESGTWIDAMSECMDLTEVQLGIACLASKNIKTMDEAGNIVYYGICIPRHYGIKHNSSEIDQWKKIISDFNPSIIMIWGTECGNAYELLHAAGSIPCLFYIQGILGRIVRYPEGGLRVHEIKAYTSLIERLKWLHYRNNHRKQRIHEKSELEMISRSCGVITDNEWADSYYRLTAHVANIYHVSLPANRRFLIGKHNLDACERHSIFSVTCNNPAKGVHNLVKAVQIAKQFFPDIRVYLPGSIDSRKPSFLYKSPYISYLMNIIKKNDLETNVIFCGLLNGEEMKERLLKCNVFVMPSCIENHSSSLREAMYLGVPVISSEVGSVHEFVSHGNNGLLYRYEEYDVLADEICRIFSDDKMTEMLGNNAYNSIRRKYPQDSIGHDLMEIYKKVLNKATVSYDKENI